jgi:UDP-N-acetylglucosamine 2-epimerase (non-hydrolysing)
MTKVLFIVGTRPEAIKMAPVIGKFKQDPKIEVKICSTGQHREMLDQVFDFFQLKVDFDLALMRPDQTLVELTSLILINVTSVLKSFQPDWVLIQGDTTTAMAGAMAAFYEKIKIAHVEAGLRSYNIHAPFPEELNRQVISRMANIHFCPTDDSVENLRKEGVKNHIYLVGNTVVDAVEEALIKINKSDQQVFESHFKAVCFDKKIILVTCHRRESFGEPFSEICSALRNLADSNSTYEIVYPVHLNPNIQRKAEELLQHPSIKLMTPLSYSQMLWLMDKCAVILTDSGGIQEEAPTLKKPVLVLRNVTERMEGVRAGTAIIVGTDKNKIVTETIRLLDDPRYYQSMLAHTNPYGDGNSSQRILSIIQQWQ